MQTVERKLKKTEEQLTDEDMENIQTYVNEMEMRGYRVVMRDANGKEIDTI